MASLLSGLFRTLTWNDFPRRQANLQQQVKLPRRHLRLARLVITRSQCNTFVVQVQLGFSCKTVSPPELTSGVTVSS